MAASLNCDPAYVALPALAVLAGVIGNSRAIRLKQDWDEPSILWAVVVGDSGTAKSPALDKATAHLFSIQHTLMEEHLRDVARHMDELEAYKAAKSEARKGGPDPGEKPTSPPPLTRIVTTDVTVECLAEILDSNPHGLTVVPDELACWFNSFTRYRGGKDGSDLPHWLEMHRASTCVIDRKTGKRQTLVIPLAAVCVTGTVQPGVLGRCLTAEHRDAGLSARLLLAMPPKVRKKWTERVISPEARVAFELLIDALLALEPGRREGRRWFPRLLDLDPDAKKCWVTFYNEWAEIQHTADGEFASVLSKLEGCAARLALLHHVVTYTGRGDDDRVPIGRESVEAALTLVKWFANEFRRVQAQLGETPEQRDARMLIEFIRRHGGRISVRQLQRSNSRRYPAAEAAEESLNGLVTAGWATWVEGDAPEGGGHRERFAQLNPSPGGGDAGAPPGDGPDTPDGDGDDDRDDDDPAGPPGSVRAGPAMIPFSVVRDPAGVTALTHAIGGAERVAVEITTDGTLGFAIPGPDGGPDSFVLDPRRVDPTPVWHTLAGKRLAVHDVAAKLEALTDRGFEPGVIDDVLLMVEVLAAGTRYPTDLVGASRERLKLVTHAPAALSSGQPPASPVARAAWGAAAAPPGRVLVRADYSQIELRLLAKVSGDERLLEAFQHGDDVHALTARSVLRKEDITDSDRRLANAVNFGLVYGMSAVGFRRYARSGYGIALSEEQAKTYRDKFFKAYTGVASWQRDVLSRRDNRACTLLGRRRILRPGTPDTVRLNTPIQGSAADGLKAALALLWERRDEVPGAFPILAVHDELVVECAEGQADEAAAWLERAMIDGLAPLIDPVPAVLSVQVGRTWAGD